MKIREIKAYPTSFPLPKLGGVRLGIGQAVKRDCVMVKVTTEIGWVGLPGLGLFVWAPADAVNHTQGYRIWNSAALRRGQRLGFWRL